MRRTAERWSSFSVSLVLLGLSVGTAPFLGMVASTRPDTAMILGIAAATFMILAVRSLLLGRDTDRPAHRWRKSMGVALVLAGLFQVAAVRVASQPMLRDRAYVAKAKAYHERLQIRERHRQMLGCPYSTTESP
jgi:hypothetical protein